MVYHIQWRTIKLKNIINQELCIVYAMLYEKLRDKNKYKFVKDLIDSIKSFNKSFPTHISYDDKYKCRELNDYICEHLDKARDYILNYFVTLIQHKIINGENIYTHKLNSKTIIESYINEVINNAKKNIKEEYENLIKNDLHLSYDYQYMVTISQ